MELPNIQGYKIIAKIGEGSAGTVYEAEREDGTLCAIKVFENMSSNTALIRSRVSRVMDAGAHDVTVPVLAQALDSRPVFVEMPLMAERLEGGVEQYRPRTLQTLFKDYQGNEFAWPFVMKLANRLATLHSIKVAHGNLKPGNVFLGEAGGPLLADYASGLMPEVLRLGYSDSLLYAPPEQLRHPEGYNEEAGYRWDVYAFGVMAFRLLTGKFPRCHEVFDLVSPAPGTQQRFEVQVDYEEIAESLEGNQAFVWPTEPEDDGEARRREMIDFCLSLDPMGRPGDMREVARYFEVVEGDLAREEESRRLMTSEEKAVKKKRRSLSLLALMSLVALGLGGAWAYAQKERVAESGLAEKEFLDYRKQTELELDELESERDRSLVSEAEVLGSRDEFEKTLAKKLSEIEAELASVQDTNETLFDWVLEEGVDNLPVLEGRGDRLAFLYGQVDAQLKDLEKRPELVKQATLLRLRKAELVLARGDMAAGKMLLSEAIERGELSDEHTARARMRLFLLTSKVDPSQLESLVEVTEASVQKVWGDDESLSLRAEAAMELAKARMWNARGDTSRAKQGFLKSLENYKKLAELHPSNPAVSFLVGRRYLSAATAMEGEGAFENAAKLRAEAAKAFTVLAEKQKNPSPELEFQIVSAIAARAISQWQQGDTFGAEALAREGLPKLLALQARLPDDFRVIVDLAALQGIIATALRDEGSPKSARTMLTKAIKILEAGLANNVEHWGGRYLMASLKWQLSGLMGQQGEADSEFEMGGAARDELVALLASKMTKPRPSEVRKSLAYLCGDLGHSADLRGKRELALKYLQESKKFWQELASDEGNQLEIRQGYHWANNRLVEMGVR